jgi:hypothetical protein
VQVVTGAEILGVGGPVDGQNHDGDDGGNDGREQDNDKPGGPVCGLWRGLGDPHGVDEGVRDEQDELHVSSMRVCRDSIRNRGGHVSLRWPNRKGVACI